MHRLLPWRQGLAAATPVQHLQAMRAPGLLLAKRQPTLTGWLLHH